ncbi:hypothetical protein [Pantoea sp.]|uniref:hypothetical protein n=1 Tax=Pantoea sp. TaxID=69393 RepID=UPI0028A22529|nr:hypothetical protein [Pantoea sp.]
MRKQKITRQKKHKKLAKQQATAGGIKNSSENSQYRVVNKGGGNQFNSSVFLLDPVEIACFIKAAPLMKTVAGKHTSGRHDPFGFNTSVAIKINFH